MVILILFGLALVNGLLAMSEIALVAARQAPIQSRAQEGHRGARAALHLKANPDILLPTVQVGITLVATVAAAFGESSLAAPLAARLAQVDGLREAAPTIAFWIIVLGITYLNLVFGELVPKRLALHYPETIATLAAPALKGLARLARPVVWLLGLSSSLVLRLLPFQGVNRHTITEEEIKQLLAEGARAGVLESSEESLIHRVLALNDRPGARLMRPRSDVVWLDLQASAQENLARIQGCRHAKFPVCRGSLDQPVGVIGTRELFVHTTTQSKTFTGLTDDLSPPLLIPEHLSGLQILELFKESGVHLGLVVDEYGSVQGVVTLNDILEAIVGVLPPHGQPEEDVVRREDGSLLIDGALPIDRLFEILERPVPAGLQYHTLAGFVIEQLGQIPTAGDHFEDGGWAFEVMDMDGHRVDKVLLQNLGASET